MKKYIIVCLLILISNQICSYSELKNKAIALLKNDTLEITVKLFYSDKHSNDNKQLYIPVSDWIIFSRFLTDRFLSKGTDRLLYNSITICHAKRENCDWGELDGEIVKDWEIMPSLMTVGTNDTTEILIRTPVQELHDYLERYDTRLELSFAYTDYSVFSILEGLLRNNKINIEDYFINSEFDIENCSTNCEINICKKDSVHGEYYPKKKKISKEISNYLKLTFRKRIEITIPIQIE